MSTSISRLLILFISRIFQQQLHDGPDPQFRLARGNHQNGVANALVIIRSYHRDTVSLSLYRAQFPMLTNLRSYKFFWTIAQRRSLTTLSDRCQKSKSNHMGYYRPIIIKVFKKAEKQSFEHIVEKILSKYSRKLKNNHLSILYDKYYLRTQEAE